MKPVRTDSQLRGQDLAYESTIDCLAKYLDPMASISHPCGFYWLSTGVCAWCDDAQNQLHWNTPYICGEINYQIKYPTAFNYESSGRYVMLICGGQYGRKLR